METKRRLGPEVCGRLNLKISETHETRDPGEKSASLFKKRILMRERYGGQRITVRETCFFPAMPLVPYSVE